MTKTCTRCGDTKPTDAFHRRAASKDGLTPICKRCNVAKVTEWQRDNRARVRTNSRANRARLSQSQRADQWRVWRYGLQPDEFDRMIGEQDGKCAICRTFLVTPCIDHDHETGEIRGLLCTKCNSGLGMFGDDVEKLATAIAYLKR